MKKTYVYVDGFNLYYGALKGTPHRWLDLLKFCQLMLPQNDIQQINYYTALVGPRFGDPGQPIRQQLYLRALRTLPSVQIHLGHYLSHTVRMPLANPPAQGQRFAEVIKTEEKGSDVNLAAHLVRDAFENRFEAAVVITNDSDLLEPVRIATKERGKIVGILNPQRHPAFVLVREATFFKKVRSGVLAASQFPDELTDADGDFRKPIGW